MEEITEDSEVEDMIAAYPGEITPELQKKLDEHKEIYGLIGDLDDYKKTVYIELYGPSEEERDAAAAKAFQDAINKPAQDNYVPPTDTSMFQEPSDGEVKQFDPNHQVPDYAKGDFVY